MLQTVEPNKKYISESGFTFRVLFLAKHGQDCSYPMVVYTNLEPTADQPAGQIWTIAESIFLKRFSEPEPVTYRLIGSFANITALPKTAQLHDVALLNESGDNVYVWGTQDAWVLAHGDFIDRLHYSLHPDSRRGWGPADWLIIGSQCWVRMKESEFQPISSLPRDFSVRLPAAT